MFTGIVQQMGKILTCTHAANGVELVVAAVDLRMKEGESLAVDGACLTAIRPRRGRFTAVLSPETLSRTNFGHRRVGDIVNLERALAASGRIDGHFVLGHVDAVGEVLAIPREGGGARLVVRLPRGYDSLIVEKGSLAVNGVSLTIATRRRREFEVALIPHTLAVTNLGGVRPGDAVNIELDYLAKLVVSLASRQARVRPRAAGARTGKRRNLHATRKD